MFWCTSLENLISASDNILVAIFKSVADSSVSWHFVGGYAFTTDLELPSLRLDSLQKTIFSNNAHNDVSNWFELRLETKRLDSFFFSLRVRNANLEVVWKKQKNFKASFEMIN